MFAVYHGRVYIFAGIDGLSHQTIVTNGFGLITSKHTPLCNIKINKNRNDLFIIKIQIEQRGI
ncbi:hypothetical protein [Sporosalibacterium faouarense]|uniref:hypothetical protein n=1 Tax=Sporosalibacterium faouarense TaxID=516123 RepID=UPI00192A9FBA|nr:hypothetical protein [Sporosalibacterium faouarense]